MKDFQEIARSFLPEDIAPEITDKIAEFLPVANDPLWRDSLKEAVGRPKKGKPTEFDPDNFVQKVHRAYNRRLSELSRLYPLFNIFESSYRSFVAHTYDDIFGSTDWWREAYDIEIKRMNPAHHSEPGIHKIGSFHLNRDLSDAIQDLTRSVCMNKEARDKIDAGATTLEIIQYSKLSDLERLIIINWTRVRDAFVVTPNFGVAVFGDMFAKVRQARNTVFHHRDVNQKTSIISSAEELLELIGVHLKSLYEDATHVAVSPYEFKNQTPAKHHYCLTITKLSFNVTAHFGDKETVVKFDGTCSGEAIVRYINSLKASNVGNLQKLDSRLWTAEVAASDVNS